MLRIRYLSSVERHFQSTLEKHHGELIEFDDSTWLAVIDTVTVMPGGNLVFRFVNGMEVEK